VGRHSANLAPEPPAQWPVDIMGFLLARIGEDAALVAQVEANPRSELAITTMGLGEHFGIYISTLRLAAECESKRAVVLHRTKGTQQSAIALLDGLKAQLDAAGTDPVALRELSQALSNNSDKLSQALTRNTPAA
jgi:hypothetical protein